MIGLFAVLLFAAATPAALACGVCVEDKMAAVYDHAVIGKALGQKHHVAFFHVDGPLMAGEATKRALEQAAGTSSAADKGSVRVSVESASLAVAFDPQRFPVATLQGDLERRLSAKGIGVIGSQIVRSRE